MNEFKRILFLVLIMAAVAAIAIGAALAILYNTAFDEQRARLVVTAKSEARLLEAMMRHQIHENPDRAREHTLSQIREAHTNYQGFGETGEFTLAWREGDRIVFILKHRHHDVAKPPPAPFASSLAEPMRRALSGRSGTVVGLDYRGVTVLAAFEPVAVLDLGIVAKIDLVEIRAPFLRAGAIVVVIAVLIIAVGAGLFFLVSNPMIQRLRESEERFRLAFDESAVPMGLCDPDSGRFYLANPALCRWLGYTREEMAEKTIFDITHPDDRARNAELRRKLIEEGTGHFRFEKRYIRKDGGILWGDIDVSLLCDGQGKVLYTYGQVRDITEQKKAEEALRESEERFRDFAEVASDWFWEMDEDLRFSFFSGRYLEVTGLDLDSLIGKTRREATKEDTDDERWRQHFADMEARRPFRDFCYRLTTADGGVLHISISGTPVFDDDGAFRGYRGTGTDITELKRAEEAMRESQGRLSGAVESLQEGFVLYDADDRIVIANSVYRQMNPNIDEFLEKSMRFEDVLRANVERGWIPEAIGREEAFIRERLERHRDPGAPIIRQFGDGNWCILKETRTPDGGTAVTFTDVTDLKRVEEALEENRRALQGVVDAVPAMVNAKDPDSRYVFMNQYQADLYGVTPGDAIGRTASELVGAEYGAHTEAIDAEVFSTNEAKSNYEENWVDGDGETRVLLTTKAPLRNDAGAPSRVVSVALDITDRKRAEEALKESEDRLSGAIESLQEGFVLYDADDRIAIANSVYRQMNPEADEFLEKRMWFEDLLRASVERGQIPEAIGREEEFIRERLERHRNPQGPILRQTGDGSWYVIKETRTPEGGTAVTCTNITEQKRIEQALKEREQRFRAVTETANDAIISIDHEGKVILWNEAAEETFGYSEPEILGKPLTKIIPKRFRKGHRDGIRRVNKTNRSDFAGNTVELIGLRKDGTEFPVELSLSIWESEAAVNYVGILRDITERKKAEEALTESETRYRLLTESTGVIPWEADAATFQFTYVGPQAEKLLGHPVEDWYGQDFWPKNMHPDDQEATVARCLEATERGEDNDFEYRMIAADGRNVWLRDIVNFVPGGNGAGILRGVMIDITERKEAEEALEESEKRFRDLVEGSVQGVLIHDHGRAVFANQAYADIFGYDSPEELLAQDSALDHVAPHDRKRMKAYTKARLQGKEAPATYEFQGIGKDGSPILIENRTRVVVWKGRPAIQRTIIDITGRKQAEEALRRSEERLTGAVMSLQEGFVLFDADDRLIMMNDVYRRMEPAAEEFLELGMTFEESIRAYVERGLIVEALGREEAFIRERMEKHRNPKGPIIRQFTNGGWYIIEETRTPDGGAAMTFTDITGLKHFEAALRETQQRFKDIAESTSDWFWEMGPDLRFTYFSDRYQEIAHFDPKDRLGTRREDYLPPGELEANPEKWAAHLADLEARRPFKDFEYASTATAEGTRHIRISGKPVFDADGNFVGYRGTGSDITQYKRAEETLRKLSRAVEQSPASVVITDTDAVIEYVNPTFTTITGYSAEEAIGQTPRMLSSGETPEAVYERLWAAIKSGEEWRGTLRNRRKDGAVYLAGVSISPITAPDGTVTHFVWAQQDITQRVEGERRLKQTEKLESLGGLAGGIAHDFNNMLLPILSLTDMTRKSLPEDSRERLRLDKVIEAATRAKDLVARILAFSRQEDAVQENIDIHAAIHETMDLLRSTLLTTIKIKQRLKRDTGTVFADRAQIASVLMNLASNAADAMNGKTGEITVTLSPVKVGRKKAASIPGLREGKFAKLAVKDNGHGMDEKTLARVMDPFFTTKAVGEGTGLGLSMVHGIVSKHGGAVNISSTPGEGTTVEVYLPLIDGEAGHESRDGNGISGDSRTAAGSSRQPEAAMEKPAHRH